MSLAILIPPSANKPKQLDKNYLDAIDSEHIFVETLYMGAGKKPKKVDMVDFMEDLLPDLQDAGVTILAVVEANYFKYLTDNTKITDTLGYTFPCVLDKNIRVVYLPNYLRIFHDPAVAKDITVAITAINSAIKGVYKDSNDLSFIKHAYYPETLEEIEKALNSLLNEPTLAVDIEAFSLDHFLAGIGTITFCKSKTEGIAFCVDYVEEVSENFYGKYVPNAKVHKLLRTFFTRYTGKLLFHKGSYDTKCIIYTLWMQHLNDVKNMLKGLHIIYRNVEDTRLIGYLLYNSTVRPDLTLKKLAFEYVGKYAQDSEDIKDIRRIPKDQLLKYNLIDGLGTFYCYERDRPQLPENNLEYLYEEIFRKSMKVICQMELTGACLDPERVNEASILLKEKINTILNDFNTNNLVVKGLIGFRERSRYAEWETRKAKAKHPDKILIKPEEAFAALMFNPGSTVQMSYLLYDFIGLPVIDTTKGGSPAVGTKTLKKLINHTDNKDIQQVLNILIEYSQATKVLSTFIAKFLEAPYGIDGKQYLFGCFNLGVPVSGRLSSSDPNMQNIPSGSVYGKLVKMCFVAPEGHVFWGSDFSGLEDVVNTLLTKDPNKVKVLRDGYDGHMFRAVNYWPEDFKGKHRVADDTDEVFKLVADGKVYYCKGDDLIVDSSGNKQSVKELYDTYT